MVDLLQESFPNLRYVRITSPRSEKYNCIAWAAGDTTQWWWPEEGQGVFWPVGVPRDETLTAFVALFTWLGYSTCDNTETDSGFERVALFADEAGIPTHAARLLATGLWTSKLGRSEDIEHDLHNLEGSNYGKVVVIMRRPWATS